MLQTEQARLGANEYLDQVLLAKEPFAPIGQANWGQGMLAGRFYAADGIYKNNSNKTRVNALFTNRYLSRSPGAGYRVDVFTSLPTRIG